MVKGGKINGTSKKYPDFFKVYLTEYSSERLLIPDAFVASLDGLMPEKAILKSRINKLWHVKVGRIDNKLFFQNGWDRFVKDNLVENGDFLVFRYNGDCVFDVKILGKSGCDKGVTGTYVSIDKRPSYIKEEEEWEDEDDDSNNDDSDDYEEGEGDEGEEKDEEETEEEEDVSGAKPINKSKGQKKIGMTAAKVEGEHKGIAPVTIEEVEVRRYVNLKNPYFVTKLQKTRRNSLCVPVDVVKDHNLTLPKQMIFCDNLGRKWPGELNIWKDGRTWIEGWHAVCKWNNVTNSDWCICELLKGRGQRGNVIKIHIVRGRSGN